MKVLAYKGISWGSKLIRFYTRSEYSHIAIEWEDGRVTEALNKKGVVLAPDFRWFHTTGTPVDVFDLANCDEASAWAFASQCHGDRYDRSAIARFVTKRKKHTPREWICSEVSFEIVRYGGVLLLLRVSSETLSPGDIVSSPILPLKESRIC